MRKDTIINNSGFTTENIVESVNYIDFYSVAKRTKDLYKRDFYSSRVFHNATFAQYITSDFWNNIQIGESYDDENIDVLSIIKYDDSIEFNEIMSLVLLTINQIDHSRRKNIMMKSLVLHLLMMNKFNFLDDDNIEILREDIIYVRNLVKRDILDKGLTLKYLPKTYSKLLMDDLNETKWTVTQCNRVVKDICISVINKYQSS